MLKRILLFLPLLALVLSACEQSDPPVLERRLVWADEFDGTALDTSKWEALIGDGTEFGIPGWGNQEEQWYQAENITVFNGLLRIQIKAESVGGYDYTSARIRTANRGDFRYGRFEASIRMDNTPGLWHAFWMLPTDPAEPWPISGEIDIMEYVGNKPNEIINTIHFADNFGNRNLLGDPEPFVQDNDFHLYAVEWNENRITWFIDSVQTYSVARTNDQLVTTWPFDAQFHLILNTAVGGNLGGTIDAQALQTPKFMIVDYVRVYQDF